MHSLCTDDVKSLPSLLSYLHEEIPIIFDMLTSLSFTRFPAPWQNLFTWLYDISIKTFLADRTVLGPEASLADDPLSFFPTLPKCRERGSYQIDFQHQLPKDEDPCTKRSKGHPSLTPGIFTIYCPHGTYLCHIFSYVIFLVMPYFLMYIIFTFCYLFST